MRALVVMAVLGACAAAPFIPDDPDVAAEKARFFRTFQVIQSASLPKVGFNQPRFVPQQASAFIPAPPSPQPRWTGPLASKVPASLPGSSPFVANTQDVNAARNAFFNAYKAQVVATVPATPRRPTYHHPAPTYVAGPLPERPQPKWTGPLASQIPASLPGSSPIVADTADVQAAKNAFYNSYKQQVAATVPLRYY